MLRNQKNVESIFGFEISQNFLKILTTEKNIFRNSKHVESMFVFEISEN